MTESEIQIAMAKAYCQACLRSALDTQEKAEGSFNEATYKAWLDYDNALATLSKLLVSKS